MLIDQDGGRMDRTLGHCEWEGSMVRIPGSSGVLTN